MVDSAAPGSKKAWNNVRKILELDVTWYQTTRHSFVSRLLQAGATLDEVSSAVGHSSPIVTRRYYDHFIRKTFSPLLRIGLRLGGPHTQETGRSDTEISANESQNDAP